MPDDINFNALVEHYAGIEGKDLITRVVKDNPGRVALLSSFGAESAVLLHMVAQIEPTLPVLFLNTGKLFPETLAYRHDLARRFGLTNVQDIEPADDDLAREDPSGDLFASSKDHCCHIRKTLPMRKAFEDYDFIISGRKRFHGAQRSDLQFVSVQDDKVKVEPLAGYTALDLKTYVQMHELPPHPLVARGFRSIGCEPCTIAGGTDDDPRAGRWAGSEKTECGIHFSATGEIIRTSQAGLPVA